jgi:NADH dehydrogenase
MLMASGKQKVLVLGGGFGGIKAALELADSDAFSVMLLSDHDSFRYYPALYRTATGKNQAASTIGLSEILKGRDIRLAKDTAMTLDRTKKAVICVSGNSYTYDILIVAIGVVTNYFGIKGLDKYAYGIKTQDDAQALRDHIHRQLVEDQKPDVNYVVIGGGPTGVELTGALPAYLHHVIKKHHLPKTKLHVDLVEAAPRLASRMPRSYSYALQKHLRHLGIKLYLNQTVQAETADELVVSGHSIASHTVIWTAGVTNHPFFKANEFAMSDHGKTVVDQRLEAEPNIYVIGDNADTQYSGMAQTALYDAVFVAQNLKRQASGKSPRDYKPKKPVYVTPAGPHWAAVLWGGVHLYGWVGSLLRSSADLAGYHDYEPWWQASQHWLAETESDNSCKICG